jgi:hypothetical protein
MLNVVMLGVVAPLNTPTLPFKPVGVTLCPGANTKNKFWCKLTHPFGKLDCFSAMQKFTVR